MELGKKIKQLRYRCGLTQEQLAERLGISPQSVSKWETAVTMPDISLLPAFRPFLLPVYRAHIALAEYDEKTADGIMEMALEEDGENGGLLFEAAQYYARKGEHRKAIGFYERSFELEPKPRYTDALQGIAVICEILGDIPAALNAYDRMLDCIKNEWSFGEEDAAVSEVRREQSRLLQK